jgi:hypothetical protein
MRDRARESLSSNSTPTRPTRLPPGSPPLSITPTPPEPNETDPYSSSRGTDSSDGGSGGGSGGASKVWVLVAPHFSDADRPPLLSTIAAELSSRSAADGLGTRVGILRLSLDSASLAVWDPEVGSDEAAGETGSSRELSQALSELASDLSHWLICAGTGDGALVGEVISAVARDTSKRLAWIVPIHGGDHGEEGMVAAYRTIKTLSTISPSSRGRLVLGCLGSGDNQGLGWANKLRGVMRKFLAWEPADALILPPLTQPTDPTDSALHEVLRLAPNASLSDLWDPIMSLLDSTAPSHAVAPNHTAAPPQPAITQAAATIEITPPSPATAPQPAPADPIQVSETPAYAANTLEVDATTRSHASQPATAEVADAPTLADAAPEPTDADDLIIAVERKPDPVRLSPELRLTSSPDHDAADVVTVDRLDADAVLESLARAEGLQPTGINIPRARPHLRLMLDPKGQLTLLAAMSTVDADTVLELGRSLGWLRDNLELVTRLAQLTGHQVSPNLPPTARLYAARGANDLSKLLQDSHVHVVIYRPIRWGTQAGVIVEAA